MTVRISLVLALATVPGCFGTFKLTGTVLAFNQGISKHMAVREVVFVSFLIVPVYPVSALADGLVLNTIEFATGDNPIDGLAGDGRKVSVRTGPDGALEIAMDGEKVRRLIERGRRLELVEDGVVIGSVEPRDDGAVRVEHRGVVRWVSAEEVDRLSVLAGPDRVRAIASGAP